jgi:hypothetical protein
VIERTRRGRYLVAEAVQRIVERRPAEVGTQHMRDRAPSG